MAAADWANVCSVAVTVQFVNPLNKTAALDSDLDNFASREAGQNERRVRRDHKLDLGEHGTQHGDDSPLPRRMQMLVQLVDQHDAPQFGGIATRTEIEELMADQFAEPGQYRLVAR